jgi:hypothetical protein
VLRDKKVVGVFVRFVRRFTGLDRRKEVPEQGICDFAALPC